MLHCMTLIAGGILSFAQSGSGNALNLFATRMESALAAYEVGRAQGSSWQERISQRYILVF